LIIDKLKKENKGKKQMNDITITGKTSKTLAKVSAELLKQEIVFTAKFNNDFSEEWTIYLSGGY
jgi:hypothetical protein